jgi:hypothetical protein
VVLPKNCKNHMVFNVFSNRGPSPSNGPRPVAYYPKKSMVIVLTYI